MKDKFVQLDDHGAVFVRWDKVIMVEWVDSGGKVNVELEGGGSAKLIHTSVDAVFEKLDAAQERYGLEREILDLVCQLEQMSVDFEARRDHNPPDEEFFTSIRTSKERVLSRAVREYMGMKGDLENG